MMTLNNEISKAFNLSATHYEKAATVQHEIGRRLFERLDYLKIRPKRILDLGCGPGFFTRELSKKYPKAQVIGLDIAFAMLKESKKKHRWRRKWSLVSADMTHIPFATGTFDLVFANQAIHWGGPLLNVFNELNRVMDTNGCLMFTTLGPDTFKELKYSWSQINQYAHTNEFLDMHDIGDVLMQAGFSDPVVDMELLSVHYETLQKLVKSLKNQGVRNVNPERNSGLTGKHAWQQFEKNFESMYKDQGKYPLTYEVVYGHGWKGALRNMVSGMETYVPVSQIRKAT